MPCEIDDFSSVGDFLKNAADRTEVFRRTAIGRYYYGAYHHALTVANKWKIKLTCDPAKPAGYHMRLIGSLMHYRGNDQALIQSIGRHLGGLRRMRVESDYDLDKKIEPVSVNQALYRSNKVKALCLKAINLKT